MKRTALKSRRPTKRRQVLPRCSNRQCHAIARIEGMCVSHAEQLADKLFSEYVRDRDDTCTLWKFGLGPGGFSSPCEGPLQAAHGEPRGNHATRYDPRNVHAVCRKHHMLLDAGSKHALKAEWLRSILGDDGYLELLGYALAPTKRAESVEDALAWLRPVEATA